jgi:cyclopropane-fatty-acyl-phospholipid synthase
MRGNGVAERGRVMARVVARPFHRLLDRIDRGLVAGGIEADLLDGTHRRLGGHRPGPVAIVTLHRWRSLVRLATAGSIGWYEGWAAGDWSSPDPVPLFDLFMRNRTSLGQTARSSGPVRLAARLLHWRRRNDPAGSRRNIAEHYDLGNDFYSEWLDASLTYSSALFDGDGDTLEAAQARKLEAILDRTGAQSGGALLEIGCGWGSLALLAAKRGLRVDGLTLSTEQRDVVERRAREAGADGVRVLLQDYRDVEGRYDAVASIEMVEAVGEEYWPAYLDTVARVLAPGGRAAIQFISIADDIFERYSRSVDFIQRYIFPGGMLMSQSRFRALAEERGLAWTDQRDFGLFYAETLKEWRVRFDAAVTERRLPARFDAEFVRLWRYYLMYCEGGFRGGGIDVSQVTLVKR